MDELRSSSPRAAPRSEVACSERISSMTKSPAARSTGESIRERIRRSPTATSHSVISPRNVTDSTRPAGSPPPTWRTRRTCSGRTLIKPLPSACGRHHTEARGDVPFEHVAAADEFGHERARRRTVHLGRRSRLDDAPFVHHRDAIAHAQRFGLIVRDVDHRDSEPPLQRAQLQAHLLAQTRVEVRERLVEQEQARPAHQRARERQTLLLAARELRRQARRLRIEPHQRERFFDPRDASRSNAHPDRRLSAGRRRFGTPSYAAKSRSSGRPSRCRVRWAA